MPLSFNILGEGEQALPVLFFRCVRNFIRLYHTSLSHLCSSLDGEVPDCCRFSGLCGRGLSPENLQQLMKSGRETRRQYKFQTLQLSLPGRVLCIDIKMDNFEENFWEQRSVFKSPWWWQAEGSRVSCGHGGWVV